MIGPVTLADLALALAGLGLPLGGAALVALRERARQRRVEEVRRAAAR